MTTEPDGYESAEELLRAFRRKSLSPVEVLQAQIARDARFGERINAFSERMYESALETARAAERRYLHADDDEALPALLGLTVAPKELHGMRGHGIVEGVEREPVIMDEDVAVIRQLRRAGAVFHARTTTPEASCATFTESKAWGITRNPWNEDYSPGGSSGGSSAALAAGFTTLATGTDIAGSIRVPPAFTGTVGFKPPGGEVPMNGPLEGDWYVSNGPMARTVRDAALMMNALVAPPATPGQPGGTALSVPTAPDRLRVALCVNLGGYAVHPEVERNTREVASQLADAGHHVEEIEMDLDIDQIHRASFAHYGSIVTQWIKLGLDESVGRSDYLDRFIADTERYSAQYTLFETLSDESEIRDTILRVFELHDVLLAPTSGIPALEIGNHYEGEISLEGRTFEHYWQTHLTIPFNIANRHPVLAVPSGVSSLGVPTGVQLVGARGGAQTVFDLGYELEQIRGLLRPAMS